MSTTPLFCKPFPEMDPREVLFFFTDLALNGKIAFRSLYLPTDLDTIHDWVNQPYARRYWQMNVGRESLIATYTSILNNPLGHSYIGLFNNRMVCQVDLYHTGQDELKNHVGVGVGDCGLHILMLPPRELVKGLTEGMLRAFVRFYFSFSAAHTLYGEPDSLNTAANIAARKSGFRFLRTIKMSYKTANLYSITKNEFHEAHPIP